MDEKCHWEELLELQSRNLADSWIPKQWRNKIAYWPDTGEKNAPQPLKHCLQSLSIQ